MAMKNAGEHRMGQGLTHCQPLKALTLPRRVVCFPPGDPLGLAFVRGPMRGSGLAGGSRRWWDQGWRPAGPARGCLTVPAGNQLKVQVAGSLTPRLLGYLEEAHVDALSVAGQAAPDDILALLPRLESLQALDLWSVPIDDDGLSEVWNCPWLEAINLWGTRVSDSGLAGLATLRWLRRLTVPGQRTGDRAMALLATLGALRELDLSGSSVTDAGLADLADAGSLRRLSLWGTAITDDGLQALAAFPRLSELDLGATAITDAGLGHLRALGLRRLSLVDTLITHDGLRALRGDLPSCRIEPMALGSGCAGRHPRMPRARPRVGSRA